MAKMTPFEPVLTISALILSNATSKPSLELEVLKDVDEERVLKAKSLLQKRIVDITVKEGQAGIYVTAVVRTSKGAGRAIIKDTHTNIVLVEADGKIIYKKEKREEEEKRSGIANLEVADLMRFSVEEPMQTD